MLHCRFYNLIDRYLVTIYGFARSSKVSRLCGPFLYLVLSSFAMSSFAHLRIPKPLCLSTFPSLPATDDSHCRRFIGKMRGRGRNSAWSIKFFADLDFRKALRDSSTKVGRPDPDFVHNFLTTFQERRKFDGFKRIFLYVNCKLKNYGMAEI